MVVPIVRIYDSGMAETVTPTPDRISALRDLTLEEVEQRLADLDAGKPSPF